LGSESGGHLDEAAIIAASDQGVTVTPSTIRGSLKDIQPNRPKPTLELSFSRADASCLPQGRQASIVLEIGRTTWNGTLCTDGTRRPYVHTYLEHGLAKRLTCTAIFRALELAHESEVEFRIAGTGVLTFVRIVRPGAWPPNREPDRQVIASEAGERLPSSRRSAAAPQKKQDLTAGVPFPFEDPAEIIRLAEAYWNKAMESGEAVPSLRSVNCINTQFLPPATAGHLAAR
jgi:hypothetical protein